MKVLIVVTHLLGTGHLARALTLGRAFAAEGHTVTLASGGLPVPQFNSTGLHLVQLPPLRSDGTNFTRLLSADNTAADPAYFARRQSALLAALAVSNPEIIITELFPFGRRSLRAEFIALMDAAKTHPKKPAILASIRDILAPPSTPEKAAKTDALIAQYYDGVLVHSDPATVPLEQSWPVTPALAAKLHYTGYVAPPAAGPHPEQAGTGEVIVSTGGGSVGLAIFETALKAAHQTSYKWRLLIGGNAPPDWLPSLQILAHGTNAIVEPARPDFRQLLTHASVSISMCGYNTALDLLQAATPSLLIPFDDGGEVEQSLRAKSLARSPQFRVLPSRDLTPEALLTALNSLIEQPVPHAQINYDGAAQSVTIARKIAKSSQ